MTKQRVGQLRTKIIQMGSLLQNKMLPCLDQETHPTSFRICSSLLSISTPLLERTLGEVKLNILTQSFQNALNCYELTQTDQGRRRLTKGVQRMTHKSSFPSDWSNKLLCSFPFFKSFQMAIWTPVFKLSWYCIIFKMDQDTLELVEEQQDAGVIESRNLSPF